MEAGAPWITRYSTAQYWLQPPTKAKTRKTHSSFRHLHRRRRHWWGTHGPRCGGAEEREAERSWWRRGDGRWEKGSAPHGWGCCWGSAWGWWPAACGPSLPSACASVEVRWRHEDIICYINRYIISLMQTQDELKSLLQSKGLSAYTNLFVVLSSFSRTKFDLEC